MAKKVSKNSNCNVELLQDEIKFLQNLLLNHLYFNQYF